MTRANSLITMCLFLTCANLNIPTTQGNLEKFKIQEVTFKGSKEATSKLKEIIKDCRKQYPEIARNVFNVSQNYDFITVGKHPKIFVGGEVSIGGKPNYFFDVESVINTFPKDLPVKEFDNKGIPRWATTRCMALLHEVRESQKTKNHADGIAEENRIRKKRGIQKDFRLGNTPLLPHLDHYDSIIPIGPRGAFYEKIHTKSKRDYQLNGLDYYVDPPIRRNPRPKQTIQYGKVHFTGNDTQIRKLDLVMKNCERLYPAIYKNLIKHSPKNRTLFLGNDHRGIFGGVNNRGDFYIDINAIDSVLPKDIDKNTEKRVNFIIPDWATTQGMALFRLIKYSQSDLEEAMKTENKIRKKINAPAVHSRVVNKVRHENHSDSFVIIGDKYFEVIHGNDTKISWPMRVNYLVP